jgi:hypothetical protein
MKSTRAQGQAREALRTQLETELALLKDRLWRDCVLA